jgi:predicted nucleic acid-binding Zn ribbon protein
VRKGNEQPIKDVISEMLSSYHIKDKLAEVDIVQQWEKLMGKLIAKNTQKLYIKDKKLFLHIESSALKQELTYSKSKIIEIINNESGTDLIHEVIIR